MSKNNDYATGNLWNYEYLPKHCKLIAIDLSKQIEQENPNFNFLCKLEKDNGVTMLFIIKKSEDATFNFSQISIRII